MTKKLLQGRGCARPSRFAVVGALVVAASAFVPRASAAAESHPRVIRWALAHARGSQEYDQVFADFARRVESKSRGALKVELVDGGSSEPEAGSPVYESVTEGKVDMAQLDTAAVGVDVFQLPFIFRDHDHAAAVFDGPLGRQLLDEIGSRSDARVRGLAFTYSGGYRVLLGRTAVSSVDGFKGLRIKSGSPYQAALTKALRATPATTGSFDLAEAELSRIKTSFDLTRPLPFNTAMMTRHRMYTTAIVANKRFLDDLTEEQRRLVIDEARTMARAERQVSIALEVSNTELLKSRGVQAVEFSAPERTKLESAAAAARAAFPQLAALAAEVQKTRSPRRADAQAAR